MTRDTRSGDAFAALDYAIQTHTHQCQKLHSAIATGFPDWSHTYAIRAARSARLVLECARMVAILNDPTSPATFDSFVRR